MDRKEKLFFDIIAINAIFKFVQETPSFEAYIADEKTRSAVERKLVVIGEAINLLRKTETVALVNANQIVAFRNRLVHAYDSIDDAIVWAIIKKHLEPLKNEILLRNFE